MKLITSGLYGFSGLLVGRVYAIEDADGLTLVDAGLEQAADNVLKQLAAAGHAPGAVKRILLTHAHPDHALGLPKLQAATGAAVITSEQEKPVVEGKQAIPTPDKADLSGLARLMRPGETFLKPTPVSQVVQEGDVLPVLGGLQVVETPGHAPGHISFWQPDRRILFSGDVLMRLPRLRLPFAGFTVDMAQNRRSLRRLAGLEPTILCFGHGNPLTENTAAQLRAFADKAGA